MGLAGWQLKACQRYHARNRRSAAVRHKIARTVDTFLLNTCSFRWILRKLVCQYSCARYF